MRDELYEVRHRTSCSDGVPSEYPSHFSPPLYFIIHALFEETEEEDEEEDDEEDEENSEVETTLMSA
ncbi:hypothetical protein M0802_004262 [Mischocyttarus mexicanus]|nr:hypothetical protein M0802_004262 [Mischocyttarus mexicanus]